LRLLRPAIVITGFTVGAQILALLSQTLIAANLGATTDADSLFAAMTLPQYVTAIFTGALSIVLIPAFVHRRAEQGEEVAWRFASDVVNATAVFLLALVALAMVFSRPLLTLVVPGLSAAALGKAAAVSLVVWPSVAASGLVAVLTSLHQVRSRFTWSSFVPLLGAAANLALLVLLASRYGVTGVAIAFTANLILQAALLANAFARGQYRPSLRLTDAGLREVARLAVPLVLSGAFARSTIVVDRFLASGLPAGTISHLGYAFRIVSALSIAISSGLGAVLFPPLSDAIARKEMAEFRELASRSVRTLWLVVAPVIAIGAAVTLPAVQLVFQRGAFTSQDAVAVAGLLQIYLVALVALALATITGPAMYALRATRFLAIMIAVESIAYVAYTFELARALGAPGIAWGFALYAVISIGWQSVYLRIATGGRGGRRIARSLATTTAWAGAAGVVAWLASLPVHSPLARVALGGACGLAAYLAALCITRPEEAKGVWKIVRPDESTATL
jgi:putative peptidoglycan lipid II flippase